uniref:hypothetical protein n=1 Tax=Acetobacter malorum TaxID=178901 RepID=UPI001FC91F4B|nr:hypothetical protein [Acetobacter malorum]
MLTSTPIAADTPFPMITAYGFASGLAGTAKTRTDDAPMGATMAGRAEGTIRPVSARLARIPQTAPRPTARERKDV